VRSRNSRRIVPREKHALQTRHNPTRKRLLRAKQSAENWLKPIKFCYLERHRLIRLSAPTTNAALDQRRPRADQPSARPRRPTFTAAPFSRPFQAAEPIEEKKPGERSPRSGRIGANSLRPDQSISTSMHGTPQMQMRLAGPANTSSAGDEQTIFSAPMRSNPFRTTSPNSRPEEKTWG
jgi:hypothetical protein